MNAFFEKYPTSQTLVTSRELGWSNILAELRSHPRGIIASRSAGDTELMLLLRGRSRITREAGAIRQTSEAAPGMLWLTPAGLHEDLIEISNPLPEALHVFLPATQFCPGSLAATDTKVTSIDCAMSGDFAIRCSSPFFAHCWWKCSCRLDMARCWPMGWPPRLRQD
jgi:hypothetical protein